MDRLEIPNDRDVIILASHDDGTGSHTIISYICHAIFRVAAKHNKTPFIIYLNSSAYQKNWARDLWDANWQTEWQLYDPKSTPIGSPKKGIWIKQDNMIHLETNSVGELDPAKTKEMLIAFEYNKWAKTMPAISINKVKLAIEMGVPQLNKWVKSKCVETPAITVGDQMWSMVLQKILELSGEYNRDTNEAIFKLTECERCADEAWLLPFLAPRDYADSYALANIPMCILPGLFGARGTVAPAVTAAFAGDFQVRKVEETNKAGKLLIVINTGSRGVWQDINIQMAAAFYQSDKYILLFSQSVGDLGSFLTGKNVDQLLPDPADQTKPRIWLVTQNHIKEIPNLPSLLDYYTQASFGITRGGVSALEFVNAEIPFLVVQEPNHWLSLKQQANLREGGVAYTSSLSNFKANPMRLIDHYVHQHQANQMSMARMEFINFDIEDKWVEYLLRYYGQIIP